MNLLESYLSWTMVKRRSNILVHQTRREENEEGRERRGKREKRKIEERAAPHRKEEKCLNT